MKVSGKSLRVPTDSRHCARVASIGSGMGFILIVLHSALFAAIAPELTPRSALIRTGPIPGVRFNSGLTICDEELRHGRWVSRYWESSGQIVADIQLDAEREQMDTLPVDAFNLEAVGKGRNFPVRGNGSEPANPKFRIPRNY